MTPGRPARLATATAVVLAAAGGLLTAAATQAAADSWYYPCYADDVGFERQFFPNTTFSGKASRSDCDPAIDDNWGTRAPNIVLDTFPSNNFSVRWTKTRDFGSGGPFTFAANAQDGVRVYLDGVRKIDLWKDVSSTVWKSVNLAVPAGEHTIRVDFVNWTGNANVKFRYEPRTSASVDKVKPLKPYVNLTEYDQGLRATRLQWMPGLEMDLAGYRIYRRLPGNPWPAKPHARTTSPWYRDSTVPADGWTYYYDIRAVDKAGNESPARTGTYATTPDEAGPVFSDFSVTRSTRASDWDSPVLSWEEKDPHIGGDPTVYRGGSADGPFYPLDDRMTGFYSANDDTAPYGETSYYKVVAADWYGHEGESGVIAYTRPLPAPRLAARTNERGTGIDVSWGFPSDASVDFQVYRWEADVIGAVPELMPCEPRVERTEGTTITYACTDTSTVVGRRYGYRVVALYSGGRQAVSEDDTVFREDRTPPPAVTGLTVVPAEYGTVIGWDPIDEPDLKYYRIFRTRPEPDGGSSGFETVAGYLDPGQTEWIDRNAPDGQTWVYYVYGVDQSGNSLFTLNPEEVSHTEITELDLRPPAEATPVDDAPWTLQAPLRSADGQAELTWSCSTGECAAAGFHVLRWDREAGRFVRLTEEALPGDARTWTDTTVPAGTTSHYVLEVVVADGSLTHSGVAATMRFPAQQ